MRCASRRARQAPQERWPSRGLAEQHQAVDGHRGDDCRLGSVVGRGLLFAEGADHEVAVDDAELPAAAEFEGVGGNAVDIAEAAVGLLVDESEGIGGEDLALGSGSFQAVSDVLGGVTGRGLAEREAGVDSGPEGAVLGETKALPGLGQPDEDEREQVTVAGRPSLTAECR